MRLLCPWVEISLFRRNEGDWNCLEASEPGNWCIAVLHRTIMEQPICKGSVLDDFNCNEKDLLEVKQLSEQDRCTIGLK